MITFKKIEPDEFKRYGQIFIKDYSEDLSVNHGYSPKESLAIATRALSTSFPNNISTASDVIICIMAESSVIENNVVGFLWYNINSDNAKAYICDFFIFEQHRSKGHGKSAIALLESELAQHEINYLGLRVANNNPRALALYQDLGFNISGLNMSKRVIPKRSL
jgi:ribosomal protein S18 acetylase RimI-like enzyme